MKIAKILNIKREKKQTYDITVNDNHNFFCNNHLIHNCGYTGEIKVILINLSQETQVIESGDKIAQAVICPVVQGRDVILKRVLEIKEKDRNENGFGSTGN